MDPHPPLDSQPNGHKLQDKPSKQSVQPQNDSTSTAKPSFEPTENPPLPPNFTLPDESWLNVISAPCTFPSDIFDTVMFNLIQNPNITSSHLFRADIFYDSDNDRLNHSGNLGDGLVKHLKPEYRPISAQWPDFTLQRTIVRQMIPRNPRLDQPLLQTCHFFQREHNPDQNEERTDTLILYIPHVTSADQIPFYHPSVRQLAFLHTFTIPNPATHRLATGSLSILYLPFPSPFPSPAAALSPKTHRTALHLLSTLHKHGHGQSAGYAKRVHHDRVLPQKRYQDTYARLKARHGRALSESWAEVTDPGKHVFEDLGIAAFLIELWSELYADFPLSRKDHAAHDSATSSSSDSAGAGAGAGAKVGTEAKPSWKGFVDVGCGNGVLVHILLAEGCGPGWGFDARERKSWTRFTGSSADNTAAHLHRRVLVPAILQDALSPGRRAWGVETGIWHDGDFPPAGTFVISNHADQLTVWTPLLAWLNRSFFIAIPCCSHDFGGARFRAPVAGGKTAEKRKKQKKERQEEGTEKVGNEDEQHVPEPRKHAAESGSLARPASASNSKTPSAYASLCAYVAALADEVGFEAETEILRIPSTRNACIVGRRRKSGQFGKKDEEEVEIERKRAKVVEIVEREMKKDLGLVAEDWVQRVEGLMKKPGSGH